MKVYEDLKARGLIAQVTDEEAVRDLLDNHKCTFYIGFDPTADSLHVGHFVTVMTMSRLQKAGHTPIALFGGGTGMIGDPTGKTDMRKMLTREEIDHNVECFRKQMAPLVDFSDGKAIMANNADWLLSLNYIQFMREIGVHFSVNRMLAAECYKQRLERGLTFFEMNYMLMQGYDFLQLNRRYGCVLEVGGDDQWSNIIGGVNLIRCKENRPAYGLTLGLLTNSEGKKMGKTEKGAVWLDPAKTSPFDFYQYWRNIGDADVERCLKFLTFLPVEEIEDLTNCEGSALNKAKEVLAYEVTKSIHGIEEADKVREGARALFGGGVNTDNMPTSTLTAADLTDGSIGVLDLLVKTKLVSSKSEGRRLVQQGGLTLNDSKVKDPAAVLTAADFPNGAAIIRKGKKAYHKVLLK
ncbi:MULTISPECIES: tyrosine--tRNA ligase [Caproicibacterium]|jgi:tyrosyl-tRNA synthetase|uniref:Tyrosine--tRNA ligase n=1 Tax=Caproicibacterium lactatifermentans TaxID=2666138 RepID=A0ABX6PTL5_9FIRM|nr:tyrosine--tRNA ligase [Caproicibacterium lactatifermentans]ARP50492.1 tyrosine--tRNA ligase [Ruminococcaceae bacterium CPB6]QKO29575.1 tyrosine--tRNA ligase [Caproicibacterium lactatifermentans]